MSELVKRLIKILDDCWDSFSAKVGGGLIEINKEASMQLHFAYLLKNSVDLAIHHKDESISIELETGIHLNGKLRECDIIIKMKKGQECRLLPLELKCYKTISSSGKHRGAQDIFKYGIYEDLQLLEGYADESYLRGIQLTMTDYKSFAFPKSKSGKSWDYDISDGTTIINGTKIETPIGGKPASIVLEGNYEFRWHQVVNYYFLKLKRKDNG